LAGIAAWAGIALYSGFDRHDVEELHEEYNRLALLGFISGNTYWFTYTGIYASPLFAVGAAVGGGLFVGGGLGHFMTWVALIAWPEESSN